MEDSKKPVVMQILPSLENGGVERGTIDVAKALKNNDFSPIVVSKGGVLTYQLREAEIPHINLDVSSKNPFKVFFNIKKIANLIISYDVDIVHARSRIPMWSAYFACKKTGAKLVSTVHGPYSLKLLFGETSFLKRCYNSVMLRGDAVIAVSNFIKDYIFNNYQNNNALDKRVRVIHRGADLKHFNPNNISKNRIIDLVKKWNLADDKRVILMPARFTSWKGHEFLIDSLAKVDRDFVCVMVGSDHGHKKFRKKLESEIIAKNLAEKIKIVGICKDMPAAYGISHVVICPSVKPEAFGRIPIESQASKKVIIATKIGGALETVVDGKTGFLVEPKDVDELAKKITEVLDMPKFKIDEMSEAGRQNVEENFSNEKMCVETIKVYKFLLNLPQIL